MAQGRQVGSAVIRGGLLGTFTGLVVSIGNAFVGVVLAAILLPEDMGLYRWAAALGLAGAYAASFGLEDVLAREIIRLREAGQEAKAVSLVRRSLKFRLLLSAGVFALLFGLVGPALYLFSSFSPRGLYGYTVAVLIGLGSLFWVNLNIVTSILDSTFRLTLSRTLILVQFVLSSSLRLALTYLYGIAGLALATFAYGLVTVAVAEIVLYIVVIRPNAGAPLERGMFARFLRDSGLRTVLILEYTVLTTMDVVMLALLFPEATVGQYGVARIVIAVFVGLASPIGIALYPYTLSQLTLGNRGSALGMSLSITSLVSVFAMGLCMISAPPFIMAALPAYAESVPWVVMMAPTVFFQFGFYSALAAVAAFDRRFQFQIAVYALMTPILAGATWWGSMIFGPAVAAMVQGVAFLGIHGPMLLRLVPRNVRRRLARELVLSATATVSALSIATLLVISLEPLPGLLAGVTSYAVLFVLLYGRVMRGLDRDKTRVAARILGELGVSRTASDRILGLVTGRRVASVPGTGAGRGQG